MAVLVSGTGSNLQAILDQAHGHDGIEVAAVASSAAGVRALDRARVAGIDAVAFEAGAYETRGRRDEEMAGWLEARDPDLIVLAGFMELLSPAFLRRFPDRVINVHPALLPAFPGAHPIEDQLSYGVKVGGVTVHFVDEGVDTGPIILQEAVRLPYTRDPEVVRNRLHETEHRVLPRAIRLLALGAVRLDQENPRLVHVDDRRLEDQP